MPVGYSGVFSVYLLTLTPVFCLNHEQIRYRRVKALTQDENQEVKQSLSMGSDITEAKDADDIASFKELIGEARQIFKESEDVCTNHNNENSHGHKLKLVGGYSGSKSVYIFGFRRGSPRSTKPPPAPISVQSSSSSSSSIVLLGDIFEVRDVVPDHEQFTDKLSWVQFTSDNYRMDLLLDAKDKPFKILRNDKFAITFREDSKFNQGLTGTFKPGSFDHIMNGTLYKTLISDSSVHPTKTLDILYITFGNSFLKLRANAGEFRYFKNCKQLYILFQKLAFK